MEVFLSIPDDLVKYIEYIPKEALPEVIVSIMRKDILGRLEEKQLQTVSSIDTTMLMQLLQRIQDTGMQTVQSTQIVANQENTLKEDNKIMEEKIIKTKYEEVKSMEILEDDEDLGDLLDLLK